VLNAFKFDSNLGISHLHLRLVDPKQAFIAWHHISSQQLKFLKEYKLCY